MSRCCIICTAGSPRARRALVRAAPGVAPPSRSAGHQRRQPARRRQRQDAARRGDRRVLLGAGRAAGDPVARLRPPRSHAGAGRGRRDGVTVRLGVARRRRRAADAGARRCPARPVLVGADRHASGRHAETAARRHRARARRRLPARPAGPRRRHRGDAVGRAGRRSRAADGTAARAARRPGPGVGPRGRRRPTTDVGREPRRRATASAVRSAPRRRLGAPAGDPGRGAAARCARRGDGGHRVSRSSSSPRSARAAARWRRRGPSPITTGSRAADLAAVARLADARARGAC